MKSRNIFIGWLRIILIMLYHLLSANNSLAATLQALVIGNGDYLHGTKLSNTGHDAQAIAKNLEQYGFKVQFLSNATGENMRTATTAYAKAASRPDTVSVIYYSGHGFQYSERNWLLGTDASANQWRSSSLDIQSIISGIAAAPRSINITVLDACRTLPPGLLDGSMIAGLRPFSAPPGSLIAFATAPGAYADEGSRFDGLSLFTKHLVREMGRVAVPIDRVFRSAQEAVTAESKGDQVPWLHSSLTRDYFLLPGLSAPARRDYSIKNAENSSNGFGSLVDLYDLLSAMNYDGSQQPDRSSELYARAIASRLTNGIDFSRDELIAMSRGLQKIGARFSTIPDYAQKTLGAPSSVGILVTDVDPGSAAGRILREGDVVISINGKNVSAIGDLVRIASTEVIPGAYVNASVLRNKVPIQVGGVTERSSVDELVMDAAIWNGDVAKNYRRAQELATWAADRGNSHANVLLANYAANGLGKRLFADYAEMVRRAQLASDSGNLRGKFWLMQAAARGWGVPRSIERANELRQEAAAQGAPWAIAGVGIAYLQGQGVSQDFTQAKMYLEIGAAFAHPDALFGMGYIYENGLGVTKDLSTAITWYKRAFDTGNISVMSMSKAALNRIGK